MLLVWGHTLGGEGLASPSHSWKNFSSMQEDQLPGVRVRDCCTGWEVGQGGSDVSFSSNPNANTLGLSVYWFVDPSLYCLNPQQVPCWWWLYIFLRTQKVHFVGRLMLFICLSPSDQGTDVDRVSTHLTCEKGHVLFGLGHSSFYILAMGHFAMALPNCSTHSNILQVHSLFCPYW